MSIFQVKEVENRPDRVSVFSGDCDLSKVQTECTAAESRHFLAAADHPLLTFVSGQN